MQLILLFYTQLFQGTSQFLILSILKSQALHELRLHLQGSITGTGMITVWELINLIRNFLKIFSLKRHSFSFFKYFRKSVRKLKSKGCNLEGLHVSVTYEGISWENKNKTKLKRAINRQSFSQELHAKSKNCKHVSDFKFCLLSSR